MTFEVVEKPGIGWCIAFGGCIAIFNQWGEFVQWGGTTAAVEAVRAQVHPLSMSAALREAARKARGVTRATANGTFGTKGSTDRCAFMHAVAARIEFPPRRLIDGGAA